LSADQEQSLEQLSINTIRTLAIDAIQKANSGIPVATGGRADGVCVVAAASTPQPHDPHWPDRDRFVLSAGHGSMLLYCLLYLTGYDLALEDLQAFRQWESRTPGHPRRPDPGSRPPPGLSARARRTPWVWHWPSALWRTASTDRLHNRGPPHLRAGLRRRSHGGHLCRSRLARRPPQARQAHLPLRQQ